jgi:hypothetical protein
VHNYILLLPVIALYYFVVCWLCKEYLSALYQVVLIFAVFMWFIPEFVVIDDFCFMYLLIIWLF